MRKRLNLKQSELAAICGIASETLSRIENGKAAMPIYAEVILMLISRDEEALRAALEYATLPR